ncbi:hypothetical protein FJY63_15510, partial [Candidatus Sumerlaeota bacterium]|nr:hypothetical protein [Candidatus Sumerlaeota bacterium]
MKINFNRMALIGCLIFGALGAFLTPRAWADYIILRNGKRLTGLVRSETQQLVTIETEGGVLALSRDAVERVQIEPTSENMM